jgi:8-oxo-dGTP diphosphatase
MSSPNGQSRILPSIGVGGLIFDDNGRVLLVQRTNPPQAGLWHIPGGRLEPGESLADCCRREIQEETGLLARPGPIVAVADRQIEGFHYIILDFLAELLPGSPADPVHASDAGDAIWVDVEALHQLPLVEGLAEIIARGRQLSRNGTSLNPHPAIDWLYL